MTYRYHYDALPTTARDYLDGLLADQRQKQPGIEVLEKAQEIAQQRLRNLASEIRKKARQASFDPENRKVSLLKCPEKLAQCPNRLRGLIGNHTKLEGCLDSIEKSLKAARSAQVEPQPRAEPANDDQSERVPAPSNAKELAEASSAAAAIVDDVLAAAVDALVDQPMQVHAASNAEEAAEASSAAAAQPPALDDPQVASEPVARVSLKQRIGKTFSGLWQSLKSLGTILARAWNWMFTRRKA